MASKKLGKLLVSGFGSGYLPIAPGTWGSGAVAAIFFATALASDGRGICLNGTMGVILVLSSIVCVAFGRMAQETFGRKDPSECVADEWAGQALALIGLPLGASLPMWQAAGVTAAAAFFAFRFFDIVKPPPARQLESLPYGWGVLLDDLAAGIYANLVCQLVLRLGLNW
jgi:phosphatidylglycerophosphatase A